MGPNDYGVPDPEGEPVTKPGEGWRRLIEELTANPGLPRERANELFRRARELRPDEDILHFEAARRVMLAARDALEVASFPEPREDGWEEYWCGVLVGASNFDRGHLVLERADQMDDRSYWKAVASAWSDCERSPLSRAEWRALFGRDRPRREEFMEPDERAYLASLPERVTVYRGSLGHLGMSWTTNPAVAEWFAARFAFGPNQRAIVNHGWVYRDRIIAVQLGRNEAEVLAWPRHVHRAPLKVLDADQTEFARDNREGRSQLFLESAS